MLRAGVENALRLASGPERRLDRHFKRLIEQRLAECKRGGGTIGEFGGSGAGLVEERFRGCGAIGDTETRRLLRIDRAAGKDQLFGA